MIYRKYLNNTQFLIILNKKMLWINFNLFDFIKIVKLLDLLINNKNLNIHNYILNNVILYLLN